MIKNPPANAEGTKDPVLVPGSGRSPGGRSSNLLQNSCLENPMERGAWWAIVHAVAKESDTAEQLSIAHTQRLCHNNNQTPNLCDLIQTCLIFALTGGILS